MENSTGKIIILEGVVGCGKTTFSKSYASTDPNVVVMEEWVDEKILSDYLSNMKEKATFFQYEAQRQSSYRLHKAIQLAKSGKIVLIDRGIIGNRCFAEVQYEAGYISEESMEIYRKTFTYENLVNKQDRKNIQMETWYLQCDVDIALGRIRQRNRNGESGYSLEYLTKLKSKHDELLLNNETKVINVNSTLKISAEGLIDVRKLVEVF